MVERVRNVIKRDSKKTKGAPSKETPEPKRRRKGIELLRRYPVSSSEMSENTESLDKAIGAEFAKAKPRDSVLLPLMRSTYGVRRMFILNEAKCVEAQGTCSSSNGKYKCIVLLQTSTIIIYV